MGASRGERRTCDRGHVYYERSDCPTCPQCDAGHRPADVFPASLVAPARRALEGAGIATLAQLASWSEGELLALHGLGPSSLPKLRNALAAAGLSFRAQ